MRALLKPARATGNALGASDGVFTCLVVAVIAGTAIAPIVLSWVSGMPVGISLSVIVSMEILFVVVGLGTAAMHVERRAAVMLLVGASMSLIVGFACLHHITCWLWPTWYAFAPEVRESKYLPQLAEFSQVRQDAGDVVVLLSQLDAWVINNPTAVEAEAFTADLPHGALFERHALRWRGSGLTTFPTVWEFRQPATGGRADRAPRVVVDADLVRADDTETSDALGQMATARTRDAFREGCARARAGLLQRQDRALAALHTLQRGGAEFRFLDFLYLSAATFTTVGASDILPRSTEVRFLIVLEALMSILLLGVGIDVLLPESRERKAAPAGASAPSPAARAGSDARPST